MSKLAIYAVVVILYGGGKLVASTSSLFEEIIYNEREMKSVMLEYFKYVP